MKGCPRCGTDNEPGNKFCKECGIDLVQPQASEQVSPDEATGPVEKKVCPACRTVNAASSTYCYKCGIALSDQVVTGIKAAGNPAGFWVRMAAFLIDNILITAFSVLALVLSTGAEIGDVLAQISWSSFGSATIVSQALFAAYFTFTIGRWGQTIGKSMLGLQVVRKDGSRLSYMRSFARYWSYNLSAFPLFLGFLLIALTSQQRGLHDYVCDTRVVKLIR